MSFFILYLERKRIFFFLEICVQKMEVCKKGGKANFAHVLVFLVEKLCGVQKSSKKLCFFGTPLHTDRKSTLPKSKVLFQKKKYSKKKKYFFFSVQKLYGGKKKKVLFFFPSKIVRRKKIKSTFFFPPKRNTPGFDNPRSVSACVPEAFALSTSLFFPVF